MNKYKLAPNIKKAWLEPAEYFADEWALIPPPNKNGVITELWERCVHCRESVAGYIATQLAYKNTEKRPVFNRVIKGKDEKVYLLCMIALDCSVDTEEHIREKEKANQRFKRALELLNYYEKTFTKWPQTTLHELESLEFSSNDSLDESGDDTFKTTVEMRMVVCSKNWIFSPHLLSLFILIFRAGFYLTHRNIVSYTGAKLKETKIARFSRGEMGEEHNLVDDILDLLRKASGKKWGKFLASTEEVYEGLTFKDNWTKEDYGDYLYNISGDGINSLLTGNSTNQIVSERAKTLGIW